MKIKEIEQNIEQKIIESIGVLTDITETIDDKKLTPEEKIKIRSYPFFSGKSFFYRCIGRR